MTDTMQRRRAVYRLAFLFLIIAGLWAAGYFSGITQDLDADKVRRIIDDAGPYGIVVFALLFVLGQSMQAPGAIFIAASVFAWGPLQGGIISVVCATLAVGLNFYLYRRIGGDPLAKVKRPWARKVIDWLREKPFVTIMACRVFMGTSPPFTIVLALSGVRYDKHLIASALGMTPNILAISYAVHLGIGLL